MGIEDYMLSDSVRVESVVRRLASKTKRNEENGCIEWVAKSVANGGYGTLCVGRMGHIRAHRAAWVIVNGLIPDGMYVCHRCDNPKCVNVDHLFLGTPKDNMDDKERKGRGVAPPLIRGEKHRNSKLTEGDVISIRSSDKTLDVLASKFNVSIKTIWRIKKRISWSHV